MNVTIAVETTENEGQRSGYSFPDVTCPECGQPGIRAVLDDLLCYRCTTKFTAITSIEVQITG